jgi:transcriptional regulator
MIAGVTYVPEWMPQPSAGDGLAYAKEIAFASIIVVDGGTPTASHVPVYVDTATDFPELRFHLAAKNHMVDTLAGRQALLIFRGPDGYVSPRWYDRENVPTWDYKFVHLTGIPQLLERERTKLHVVELVEHFDAGLEVDDEYVDRYLDDIRGFAISNPQVQSVFKLSQDKSSASIDGVIAGLRGRGNEVLASAVESCRHLSQRP